MAVGNVGGEVSPCRSPVNTTHALLPGAASLSPPCFLGSPEHCQGRERLMGKAWGLLSGVGGALCGPLLVSLLKAGSSGGLISKGFLLFIIVYKEEP